VPDGLSVFDLSIIGAYMTFALGAGAFFAKQAGRSIESFFVGDRKLAWWVAGTSMVATTFAADTPLLVTGIVATDGISGNWIWWAVAIAHLTAAFFFARMWRRSGVITDAEITEIRYSGKPASALRIIKALYFGLFINCLTMAWVIAAMVKISRAFFEVEPVVVITICVVVSVSYTLMGGFRSVVVTDLVQFGLSAIGAILLAVLLIASFGGLGTIATETDTPSGFLGAVSSAVESNGDRSLSDVMDLVPPLNHPTLPPIFLVTLLVAGWWRWAEGTGYFVQRMAACKDENQAEGAMIWFAVIHNAFRPWPWILVGLGSLILFPQLPGSSKPALETTSPTSLAQTDLVSVSPAVLDLGTGGELQFSGLPDRCQAELAGQNRPLENIGRQRHSVRFGNFDSTGVFDLRLFCPGSDSAVVFEGFRIELLDREMAYPLVMRQILPSGLLGLVVASLLAAFMSTIDTHVNWGASYLVEDIYRRFLQPERSQKHYVLISRLSVIVIAILAGIFALQIQNIATVWRFLLTLGAGLGSVSAIRWFWPRVTAYAELSAIGVTTLLGVALELFGTETLFGGPNPLYIVSVPGWSKILIIAGLSLATWIPVSLLGPRNDDETLRRFASLVHPPSKAWAPWSDVDPQPLLQTTLRFGAALFVLFGSLAGTGDLILGHPLRGATFLVSAAVVLVLVVKGRVGAVCSNTDS
jgi:Na+/proline symporter